MDPNAALDQLRAMVREVLGVSPGPTDVDVDANQLAETFDALDEWLTGGGFLPKDWLSARTAPVGHYPILSRCLECGADVAVTIAAQFEHVSTDGRLVRLSHRPVLTRPVPGAQGGHR